MKMMMAHQKTILSCEIKLTSFGIQTRGLLMKPALDNLATPWGQLTSDILQELVAEFGTMN